MNNLDLERLEAALAALPGAALYGLYHLAVLLRSGQPVKRRDLVIVGFNLLCAMAAGMLLAWAFAAKGADLIPWATLKDPALIGFGLGAFGWELLPLAYGKLSGRAKRELDKLEGDAQ